MPQIDQLLLVYQSQWFWLLIVLAVIYFGIGMGMVPKIEATVDMRDRRIADDLAAAERARAEADDLEAIARKAQADARADAQAEATQAKTQAAQDAANRLAKADAEIKGKLASAEAVLATARTGALAEIEKAANDAVSDIVAKVSGAKVSAAQTSAAVRAVLNG